MPSWRRIFCLPLTILSFHVSCTWSVWFTAFHLACVCAHKSYNMVWRSQEWQNVSEWNVKTVLTKMCTKLSHVLPKFFVLVLVFIGKFLTFLNFKIKKKLFAVSLTYCLFTYLYTTHIYEDVFNTAPRARVRYYARQNIQMIYEMGS